MGGNFGTFKGVRSWDFQRWWQPALPKVVTARACGNSKG